MIDEVTKEIVCCIKFCFRPARKPNLMGVYSFVYLNEDKMAVYDAESMTTQVKVLTIHGFNSCFALEFWRYVSWCLYFHPASKKAFLYLRDHCQRF